MIIKLDKDYEVKCTLGTIRDIELRFDKPIFEVLSSINKLSTLDQLKIIFCGFKKCNSNISEEEFYKLAEENIGLGELNDALENYIFQLQYPGKSKEEIEVIVQKKLQKANHLSTGKI